MLFLILEREEWREWNINRPDWKLNHNVGMCPDRELTPAAFQCTGQCTNHWDHQPVPSDLTFNLPYGVFYFICELKISFLVELLYVEGIFYIWAESFHNTYVPITNFKASGRWKESRSCNAHKQMNTAKENPHLVCSGPGGSLRSWGSAAVCTCRAKACISSVFTKFSVILSSDIVSAPF